MSGHDATEHVTAGAGPRGSMGSWTEPHREMSEASGGTAVTMVPPCLGPISFSFPRLLPSVSELWPLLQGQGQQMLDTAKPAGSAPAPAQRC